MNRKTYIEGFYQRLDEACRRSGKSKVAIAKLCGFDRRVLMNKYNNTMMNGGNIAKFCALTGTDANWLLGVSRSFEEGE